MARAGAHVRWRAPAMLMRLHHRPMRQSRRRKRGIDERRPLVELGSSWFPGFLCCGLRRWGRCSPWSLLGGQDGVDIHNDSLQQQRWSSRCHTRCEEPSNGEIELNCRYYCRQMGGLRPVTWIASTTCSAAPPKYLSQVSSTLKAQMYVEK